MSQVNSLEMGLSGNRLYLVFHPSLNLGPFWSLI